MISKTITYFPIKALLTFLIFTELLLFVGPVSYNLQYPFLLFIYLVIVNVALYLGYRHGVKRYESKPKVKYNDIAIIKSFIILALIIAPFNLVLHWGITSFNPSLILSKFIEGMTSPADVYTDNLIMMQNNSLGSFYTTIFIVLSPFSFAAIPLGINYWQRISKKYRIGVIILISIEIVYWIGIGTRKGLLDLLIIIAFMIIASNLYLLEDKKKRKQLFIITGFFVSIFMLYFVYSNLSRYNIKFEDLADIDVSNIYIDIKPFYEKYVPSIIYIPLLSISDYLCQGYYALSCALKISISDPVFTYGFGNNTFSMVMLDRFFGYTFDDQMAMTYQGALDRYYAINPTINWHSIYVWIANDFTFFGVPFIIYFIGSFLSTTWLDTVNKNNLYSAPLFSFFAIMVFYFFANNQVLSSSFIAFVVILILYIEHKKNIYIET